MDSVSILMRKLEAALEENERLKSEAALWRATAEHQTQKIEDLLREMERVS